MKHSLLMRGSMLLFLCAFLITVLSCRKDDKNDNKPDDVKPQASYAFAVNELSVEINNTSINASSFDWNFGDSATQTTDDKQLIVKHTYAKSGTYKVTLTAKNDKGVDTFSQFISVEKKYDLVSLTTSFGEMIIWLYDETPKHKANFLKLSSEGFYDNTTFHRVISNFMIQGGDPNSKDSDPNNDGQGGPGYTIDAEFVSTLKHDFGAVAAARLGDQVNPERKSSGSQFYIVNSKTGGANHLNGQYTVFGKVIKGADISVTIAQQPKNTANNRPLTDIKMQVDVIKKTAEQLKTEYNFEP